MIPKSFIDDLLRRADIVDIIDSRVKLRKAGKNYSACCPFHDEKSPSFSVSPEKQFYYCFGCGASGNAIGFVMECDRLEFREAVAHLARIYGLEVPIDEAYNPSDAERRREYKKLLEKLLDHKLLAEIGESMGEFNAANEHRKNITMTERQINKYYGDLQRLRQIKRLCDMRTDEQMIVQSAVVKLPPRIKQEPQKRIELAHARIAQVDKKIAELTGIN